MQQDKIVGCILGSALADAMGAYTEVKTEKTLRTRFPQNKDFDFPPLQHAEHLLHNFGHRQHDCHWTDDTSQVILFIKRINRATSFGLRLNFAVEISRSMSSLVML